MRKSMNAKDVKRRTAEPVEKTLLNLQEWLRSQGRAERTVRGTYYHLRAFARWFEAKGKASFVAVTPALAAEYQAALAARPGRKGRLLTPATRSNAACALISLGRYLLGAGLVERNPLENLMLPRVVRQLPDNVLSIREMERLLSQPGLDDPVELRNRALMELLYATGLRRNEALDLALEDVDLGSGEVRVRRGKGGRGRIVPLGREAAAACSAWLAEARPALAAKGDSGHFFLSTSGGRVGDKRFSAALKRYAARAGIARPVGFHTFRHSVATHLLQRGAGIRYIQELLGHRSILATQIYTRVTIPDLKRAHAKFHPRERMDV